MRKGIVLSRTLNLINRNVLGSNSDMVKWSKHFSTREGNDIELISDPDFDFLSEREREALDKGFDQIKSLIRKHGLIADILHKQWPEWENPGTGMIPLDLREILMQSLDDDDEIQRICLEIQSVQDVKASLQN